MVCSCGGTLPLQDPQCEFNLQGEALVTVGCFAEDLRECSGVYEVVWMRNVSAISLEEII